MQPMRRNNDECNGFLIPITFLFQTQSAIVIAADLAIVQTMDMAMEIIEIELLCLILITLRVQDVLFKMAPGVHLQ